jgi:hypothetical protein
MCGWNWNIDWCVRSYQWCTYQIILSGKRNSCSLMSQLFSAVPWTHCFTTHF